VDTERIFCPRRHCLTSHKGWKVTKYLGNGLREYRCHGCEKLFYYNVRKRKVYRWHPKYSSLKYMSIVNTYDERAILCLDRLENGRVPRGITRTDDPSQADIILVFGGDGMMLQAVHNYATYRKPFLGLNFGNLGFFQNPPEKFSISDLMYENYEFFHAPLLEAKIRTREGGVISEIALNDITIHEDVGQSAWLEVSVDGTTLVDVMAGDGLIISTPLGSTAYTKNAKGALLIPTLSVFELTPIIVDPKHSMPIVVPDSCQIKIKVLQPDKRQARVSQGSVFWHKHIEEVEIKRAELGADIAFFKDSDMSWENFFLKRLREKIYEA